MNTRPVKRKILLIDDDEAVISYLVLRLARFFDPISTTEPRRALRLARVERPDAIVCDIDMPEMGGGELAGLLSEDSITADIPLLYLTALVTPEEALELEGQFGGRPGVAKRAPLSELVRQINAVIDERSL